MVRFRQTTIAHPTVPLSHKLAFMSPLLLLLNTDVRVGPGLLCFNARFDHACCAVTRVTDWRGATDWRAPVDDVSILHQETRQSKLDEVRRGTADTHPPYIAFQPPCPLGTPRTECPTLILSHGAAFGYFAASAGSATFSPRLPAPLWWAPCFRRWPSSASPRPVCGVSASATSVSRSGST